MMRALRDDVPSQGFMSKWLPPAPSVVASPLRRTSADCSLYGTCSQLTWYLFSGFDLRVCDGRPRTIGPFRFINRGGKLNRRARRAMSAFSFSFFALFMSPQGFFFISTLYSTKTEKLCFEAFQYIVLYL